MRVDASMARSFLVSRLGFMVALAIFVAILAACGLQNYPYYGRPNFSYEQGVLTLSDSDNVSSGDTNFRGYEVFYRAYSDDAAASTDLSYLSDRAANVVSGTLDPDSFVQSAKGRGYVRIRHMDDTREPLISPTDASSYYVYLQSTTDWYIDQGSSTPQTKLGRNLPSNTSSDKLSFYKKANYQQGDADYSGTTSPTVSLYFVFFAAGYWLDENLIQHYGAPQVIATVIDYAPPG